MDSNTNTFWDRKIGKWLLAVGTVLGFMFGGVGLYLYLKKDNPNLEFEIISENSLFYTDESIPQIRILVDSTDLTEQNKNISVYSIKIANNGAKNISLYDYDTGDFGMRIQNGQLIDEPSLVECSSDYLKDKLSTVFARHSDSSIVIPHVIMNIEDYYILHFCVLHDQSTLPTFECFGQIVGQKKISVVNHSNSNQNNWQKAIRGSFFVQLHRLCIYGLAFLLLLFAITALYHWLTLLVKHIKKNVFLFVLKQRKNSNYIVVEDYRKNGYKNVEKAYRIREVGSNRLTDLYKEAQVCMNTIGSEMGKNRHWKICNERICVYKDLARIGYLFISNDSSVCFNTEIKEAVVAVHDLIMNDRRMREDMGLGYDIWEEEVLLGEHPEAIE